MLGVSMRCFEAVCFPSIGQRKHNAVLFDNGRRGMLHYISEPFDRRSCWSSFLQSQGEELTYPGLYGIERELFVF